jgi:hypothetical protein
VNKKPTNEQLRRRRAAAFELRDRARVLLEDASRLDNRPPMYLRIEDLQRIAEAAGCKVSDLVDAALGLFPGVDEPARDTEGEKP